MRKLSIFLTSLLSLTASVNAGCLYLGGEATFLHPCLEDPYFTIRGDAPAANAAVSTPFGKFIAVKPDLNVGFDLWWGACLDGNLDDFLFDTRVTWQYLHCDDFRKIKVSGPDRVFWIVDAHPAIPATALFNGAASCKWKLYFDTVTWDFGCTKTCCDWVFSDLVCRLAGGLRYADIYFRKNTFYEGFREALAEDPDFAIAKELCRTWGVGPCVSAEFYHPLSRGLGVTGQVGAGILVGERRSNVSYSLNFLPDFDDAAISNTCTEYVCNFNPYVETRLGLDLTCEWLCNTGSVFAGWQATRYFSAIQHVQFLDNTQTAVSIVRNPRLDLFGFYIGAQIAF